MDLIARIEAVTLKIIKQIAAGQPPCISYYNIDRNIAIKKSSLREKNVRAGCSSSCQLNTISNGSLLNFANKQDTGEKNSSQNSQKTIDFAIKHSRNTLILMVMTMSEAHHLLLTNTTKTKRSFYYDLKNETTKSLMPNQKSIDYALNSVANLLDCAPWDLSEFLKLYLYCLIVENCIKIKKYKLFT